MLYIYINNKEICLKMHRMQLLVLDKWRGTLLFWGEKFISETLVPNLWNANAGKLDFLLLLKQELCWHFNSSRITNQWIITGERREYKSEHVALPCSQTKLAFSMDFFHMIVVSYIWNISIVRCQVINAEVTKLIL